MKKLFLATVLFISALSFAQIDFSSTRFGLIAGPTYSGVKNAHNPSGKRFSVYGGAFALIPIGSDEMFYLQPQIEYLGAGEKGDAKVLNPNALYANNYISVPIFFKAYFSEAENEFFGMAGPRFAFLINQKVENPSKAYYAIDQAGNANKFNFGVALGVGYSYKRQWEMSLRYDFGISNTYPNKNLAVIESPTNPNSEKGKSEQILSVGLSYIFE